MVKVLPYIILFTVTVPSLADPVPQEEPFINIGMWSIGKENDLLKEPIANINRHKFLLVRRDQAYRYGNSLARNRPTLWEKFREDDQTKVVHFYSAAGIGKVTQDPLPRGLRTGAGRVLTSIAGDSPPQGTILSQDFFMCASTLSPCPVTMRVRDPGNTSIYHVKFADPLYLQWFAETLVNDFDEPGMQGGTGFHFDATRAEICTNRCSPRPKTPGYETQAAWGNSVLAAWQKLAELSPMEIEATLSSSPPALDIWAKLDKSDPAQRPDMLGNEFMFNLQVTGGLRLWFKGEPEYTRMIDTYKNTVNIPVFSSNCTLQEDMAPLNDNLNTPVSPERMLHYPLASFLLVKRDSPKWYFSCSRNTSAPGLPWYPEYDSMLNTDGRGTLNFGTALEDVKRSGSLYYRKFTRGAVVVNPASSTSSFDAKNLVGYDVKIINRANLTQDPKDIPSADVITIPSLDSKFLLYAAPDKPPTGEFTAACRYSVEFKADESNMSSWEWEFGDGGTSNLQNDIHTFAREGTYTVKLKVTGPGGATLTTKDVVVPACG